MKKYVITLLLSVAAFFSFSQNASYNNLDVRTRTRMMGSVFMTGISNTGTARALYINPATGEVTWSAVGGTIPLTVTATNYASTTGSEAISFTDLTTNDTLELGTAVGRDNNLIYVARTDLIHDSLVITGSPAIYYGSAGGTAIYLDGTKTGALLQSDGVSWYVYCIWEQPVSGTALETFVRDSTYGVLSPATGTDKVSESALQDPFYNMTYWKTDFVNSYYIPTNNSKIGFIGDSYTHRYANQIKKEASAIFGYGGGYENLEGNQDYETYGTLIYSISGWVYPSVRTDDYIIHSRCARSLGTSNVLRISGREFNTLKLHYRKRTAGGTFEVKRGTAGTPVSVNTAGAAGDAWYVVNYGDVTYNIYDTIFITSTSADTVDLYGFQFEYNPYSADVNFEVQNKRLEVSILSDGGAQLQEFYTDKDTTAMRSLLDTLDLSLMCITNLDPTAALITELDSLIGLFRILRPEMDILVMSAHDEKNNYGATTRALMEKVAKINNAGYVDVFNSVGSMESLIAAGAMTDSVHLNAVGEYFTYYPLFKKLFPIPARQSEFKAYSLTITGNTSIVKPNGTNFMFTSRPLRSTFTATGNMAFGNRTLENTTTGNDNVAIGYEALYTNTTGYSNIAIGVAALKLALANQNLAIGYNALSASTTPTTNTAIGHYSQTTRTTTGNQNTSVGFRSLFKNNGSFNTAIGGYAQRYSTGDNNTAVGESALNGVSGGSSGNENTAIGRYAMFGYTISAQGVGVGYMSMYTNTTGDYNTAIGWKSLYSNSTGASNVAIGRRAGYNETGSNFLYIAVDSTSAHRMEDAASRLLIYGDFDDGYVNVSRKLSVGATGAGASLPPETFTVTGTALISGATEIQGNLTFSDDNITGINKATGDTANFTTYQNLPASHGYTIQFSSGANDLSPTDAQTYGIGNNAVMSAPGYIRVYVPRSGTVKAAYVDWYSMVVGTNENISIYLRYDNTTDELIETVGTTDVNRLFDNTAMTQAVTAGHYVELKVVCPTWATNPIGVLINGIIVIE